MTCKIICDGNQTRVWIDELEVTAAIKSIKFEQESDAYPVLDLSLYPFDPLKFPPLLEKNQRDVLRGDAK